MNIPNQMTNYNRQLKPGDRVTIAMYKPQTFWQILFNKPYEMVDCEFVVSESGTYLTRVEEDE